MKNAIRFKSSAQRGELPASLRKLSLALMLALPGVLLAVPASAQQGAIVQAPAGTSTISNPTASRSGMDSRVAAGDDFNRYANGGWEDATEIPADKSSWGIFGQLSEDTDKKVLKLIEQAAQAAAGSEARKVSDFYQAYLDMASIHQLGLAPLQAQLQRIDALTNKSALSSYLGQQLRADVDPINATNLSTENLFGLWVAQGFHDHSRYTGYLLQGGLGMPDREYYVSRNPKMAALRLKYQAHIASMLGLAGVADAEAAAGRVMALETQIARSHVSREISSNVLKADTSWRKSDFVKQARGLDWDAYFAAAGLADQTSFMVWHPTALKGAAKLVAAISIDSWKDYLRFHAINQRASVLPQAFVDQKFAFYGAALNGTPEPAPRWKNAVAATNHSLGEVLGKLYAEQHFSPQAKAKVQGMVVNILAAFSQRISALDWMAASTKAEAQAKLKAMYVGVGYPDKWRDYSGLQVSATDAYGNQERAEIFAYQQAKAKLGKAVDATEWCMNPQEVNAVNMPMQNALNFPAAILQAPFFDLTASDAVNYGAIGAIIGHEISHSFDDSGAQFDAKGELRNWWSKADLAHFQKSSKALVAQYSAYKPFPDLAINGQQTLDENIADLAGLQVAYNAYRSSVTNANEASDHEFFLAYAESWRNKFREPALRNQIATNGHAPAAYRVLTVRNLDAWYPAFNVQTGQRLYLAPKARVRVW
ncbi:M13 family metallopeptidase [Undibacterium parvum]|uniref:M13 family peptidase n=1 Tax=Undibacterium parvum TaxID=401471 RepID=A0A3S9HQB7_9BURK|nr:M13 family metallopeptidase [Undibacterium parvum]AZP14308.1 M13 family peptidase [Undibacterium parvum]